MDKAKFNFHFKLMAFKFRLRDFFRPRMDILKEVGIKPGDWVLDYGCGPGGYLVPLAKLTGPQGKIYALDIQPLALEMVQNMASKKRLTNVETIRSNCRNGLPDNSIDVVLLYDILHHLSNPEAILGELHRTLKPNGILSVSDHHLQENEIVSQIVNGGLFKLSNKGNRTYNFAVLSQLSLEVAECFTSPMKPWISC
jgi:ubiquinone/menaquinone biosynthesis C-methylase UbiE